MRVLKVQWSRALSLMCEVAPSAKSYLNFDIGIFNFQPEYIAHYAVRTYVRYDLLLYYCF